MPEIHGAAGTRMMTFVFGLILLQLLTLACWTDITRHILPNWLNLLFLVSGLAQSAIQKQPQPVDALIGVLIGGGVLGSIAVAYRHYRGFDGIGMGDVKFTAAAGAWLGWMGLAPMLLIASLLGLAYAGWLAVITGGLDRERRIPFGPFLAAGTMASWLMQRAA
jgi:leader peptidase (prepilin peptidase)/N-methyltransferase